MSRVLTPVPLTTEAFAAYGDVLEIAGSPDKIINQGMCGRHHDLAKLEFGTGRAGISLFDAKARAFPYVVDMVERHPEGSQAFIPLDGVPMIVVVADDQDGAPVNLAAFISQPGQSINLHRGTWHGVLAPLGKAGRYAVVDRIGDGSNLEEHWFSDPWTVEAPATD
ncbi:ureidoglycolate lyase [Labrenzia sp. VG12]|uniref:ureidoglycolate lyase n=1 Tax=Labrenzia sp. VG12 TaxID=2021862 RepID=UPI000B8C4E33|nr:ureidoglycolate lyase [Labrenzia sp. VG12]ASP35321.1 Ureidoglycolate hydrolase [Labrenzia sp. VG12]